MDFLAAKPPFLRDIPLKELLDAKIHTADFLVANGFTDGSDEEIEAEAARSVFQKITASDADDKSRKNAVALLETPEAVRQLVAMLTAYDWQFVNQANQIRSYVVARLLEECDHPDPRIALKALELTGKVAEVGLFEDKVRVSKQEMSDTELDAKIKERMDALKRLEAPKTETVDAIFKEVMKEKA
jgi:hypothetical protein